MDFIIFVIFLDFDKLFRYYWGYKNSNGVDKMEYHFDVEKQAEKCIEWTREHVNAISPKAVVVIGISGGKDSSCTAAILKAALGRDRVLGVMMPNGKQVDIDDSRHLIETLDIPSMEINIADSVQGLTKQIEAAFNGMDLTQGYLTNTPARIRMTALFGIAAQIGDALVVNTCNRSEDIVGYSTLFGDSAGTFSPICRLTTEEVIAIGSYLGLPDRLTHKMPTDGMSLNEDGSLMGDEVKLGVSYKEINQIIRTGEKTEHFDKVLGLYKKSKFKLEIIHMPGYEPGLYDYFDQI